MTRASTSSANWAELNSAAVAARCSTANDNLTASGTHHPVVSPGTSLASSAPSRTFPGKGSGTTGALTAPAVLQGQIRARKKQL